MVLGKVIRGTIIMYYLNFVGRYQLDDSFWYLFTTSDTFSRKKNILVVTSDFSASKMVKGQKNYVAQSNE